MACSLKITIACGIVLAIIDILHGLTTLGFYGYQFMVNYFYLCPRDLNIDVCRNERYIYEQRYNLRTLIGLGEGGISIIFDIYLIICLVKQKSCLSWLWLLKSFGVIGINVFFISAWKIQGKNYGHINYEPQMYEYHFLVVSIILTLIQVGLMLLFCIIAAIFTYKVAAERTRSRRSLHPRNPKFKKNSNPSAPSMNDMEDDDINSYMNHALNDSTNKLPLPGSNGSLDRISNSETLKQPPTAV